MGPWTGGSIRAEMSSSRRRSSPSNGDAAASTVRPAVSSFTSSSSTRRSRHNGSSSSSTSSKKRRYEDIENRCRNPYCGAELENKHQRYCDTSRMCQLHRGLMLNCAWPNAPRDNDANTMKEETTTTSRRSSLTAEASADAPTAVAAATAPRRSSATATANADGKGDVAMVGGDKRPRTATPPPVESTTKRLKLNNSSSSSASTSTPTAPMATVVTAARQVKAAAIEVVPLGIGSRGGGGGRYVQSGNRSTGAPSLPPPSVSTSTASDAPPGRTPSPLLPSPRGVLPPPGSSLAPPSRVLSRANSLPVTTTNKSRDPRVRFAPTPAAASSSDADAAPGNGGIRLISTADYLNSRRNRVAGNEPSTTGASSSNSSTAFTDTTSLSSRPVDFHRSLERTSSASSMANMDARGGSFGNSHSHNGPSDAPRTLRRAHSDTTSYEPAKTDRYSPHGQQDAQRDRPHDYSGGYHASSSAAGDRQHADHHHDRSQYPQDRPPLSRTSSSTSVTSSTSHPRGPDSGSAPASSHRSPSAPSMSRAERLFATAVLRPTFSHCDPFLKLMITRMASFLPHTLSPIRNKTTKPRTQQWYIDRAQNVQEYCGKLVEVDARNGAGSLTMAGREWLSVTGTSTSVMYHELLEKALTESERWRDMILEFHRMLEEDARRLGGRAIPGVTFLKFWSTMKKRTAEKASDFEFQTSFTAGREHYHWTFVVGNVELGSGSSKEKLAAFKKAASSAALFVKSLVLLSDKEKHNVAKQDSRSVSDRTSSRCGRSSLDDRAGAESSSRRSSHRSDHVSSDRTAAGSGPVPVVTAHGAVAASATAPAPAQTPVTSATAAVERIVEEPTAATGGEERLRSDSWTEPTELKAKFSPDVRSASDNDSDRMSISDDEDNAASANSSASSSTAVTTDTAPASAATGARASVTKAVSVQANVPAPAPPVSKPETTTTPVRAAAPAPSLPAPVQTLAPAPVPPVHAPVPVPVSAPVSAPVPAPTAPTVAVTIPEVPPSVSVPLASPPCRFCVGIQASNPGAKCLRCQKSKTKAPPSKSASHTINSLHSMLMTPVHYAAQAFSAMTRPAAVATASSTSSVNVVESLPSSASSTPRNESEK